MDNVAVFGILAVVGILVLILGGLVLLVARLYRKVEQGKALIVNTMRDEPGHLHRSRRGTRSSTRPRSWTSRSRPSRSTAAARRA